MTVSSTERTAGPFTRNGTQVDYPFTFRVFADTDVLATQTTVAGIVSTLVMGSDYTVAVNADQRTSPGGTLTMLDAGGVAGETLDFTTELEATQGARLTNAGGFYPEVVENALDKLTVLIQQQGVFGLQAVRGPFPEVLDALPSWPERLGMQLLFHPTTGQPYVAAPSSGTAADVLLQLADISSAIKNAYLVGYDSLLSYGSGQNVGAALAGAGRILQGADPTGATDNTALFKALFDVCIPAAEKAILPAGTYKVSGPITTTSVVASGSLHIHCAGDVTIEVDAASTAFQALIVCQSTAINNSTIEGGKLTLNLNNKCGTGILSSHDATSDGGLVDWDHVEVNDAKMVNISAEAASLAIYGRYTLGRLGMIRVDGVDRSGTATASKGLSINEIAGPFTIDTLHVSNVLATGFAADADGVSVFGRDIGGTYATRGGSVRIRHLIAEDCQGRSCKFQLQDAIIETLTIKRQMVVSFNVPDVDFQAGDGAVLQGLLEYRKNGATSPLGATFYPFSFQQQCTDRPNRARLQNITLRSEVGMPYLAAVDIGASALNGETYIENVNLQPLGTFATTFFTRCIVEFDAGEAAASAGTTHISVRGVRGNMEGVPIIGHTTFGASVAGKLSVEAIGNENTGTFASGNKTIAAVSGSDIPAFAGFRFRDNAGFSALMMSTFTFDAKTLQDGCRFSYIRATATVTNGPVIAAGTYVDVECLGSINATSRKARFTVDNLGTMDEHYTQSGAWGVIK